jgi:hypothetical protein
MDQNTKAKLDAIFSQKKNADAAQKREAGAIDLRRRENRSRFSITRQQIIGPVMNDFIVQMSGHGFDAEIETSEEGESGRNRWNGGSSIALQLVTDDKKTRSERTEIRFVLEKDKGQVAVYESTLGNASGSAGFAEPHYSLDDISSEVVESRIVDFLSKALAR